MSSVEPRYPSGALHGIREKPPQEPVLYCVRIAVLDASESLHDRLQFPRVAINDGENWLDNLTRRFGRRAQQKLLQALRDAGRGCVKAVANAWRTRRNCAFESGLRSSAASTEAPARSADMGLRCIVSIEST